MSSPQPPYNPPLYHPHYSYPAPTGYNLQYTSPPHRNDQAPLHTHPRMHGPGPSSGHGRGYLHANRGGAPGYQNYHPVPSQHFVYGPNAATPSSPPISPSYHDPYKTHSTHAAYSHYRGPQNVPYPITWQAEPLSPLPKQLSMLTPLPPSHPAAQPPPQSKLFEPPSEPSAELVTHSSPPSQSFSSAFSLPNTEQSVPPEPDVAGTASVTTSNAVYVIWSRKPNDPSMAPAIIISPRARPPQGVIDQAIGLSTPPLTPVQLAMDELSKIVLEKSCSPDSSKGSSAVSHDNVEIPSSESATDTTTNSTAPYTPMASSPVSSNTSISASAFLEPGTSIVASTSPKVESINLMQTSTVEQEHAGTRYDVPTSPETLPVVSAVKKSWASLLRQNESSSSTRTRNPLLVSSVVGISVPGGVDTSLNSPRLTSKKQDLLALLTSNPVGHDTVSKIRPRGLVNSGNMCFANAVLQVLVYCHPFYRLFSELGTRLSSSGWQSQSKKLEGKTPLINATIQFLTEFNQPLGGEKRREDDDADNGPSSFTPFCIYDAMKETKRFDNMRGGHQEDAEEFLGFYLDTLEDELLYILNSITPAAPSAKATPSVEEREEDGSHDDGWLEVGRKNKTVITRTIKAIESPITRIFGGTFRSTLRVPSQKDSVVIETWRSLQLDIQREQVHTIGDALHFISHPQSVQVASQTRPGITVEASQQVLIEALPPILVLHLKRFLYDIEVGGVVKVGKPISFTPELDIDSELITPARRSTRVKYKLFGVLYHHGLSASGGHYTLDVLHPNRDMGAKPGEGWIRIDDELVSDVLPKDVFNDIDADHRCPYLLFYRRVGPTVRSSAPTKS